MVNVNSALNVTRVWLGFFPLNAIYFALAHKCIQQRVGKQQLFSGNVLAQGNSSSPVFCRKRHFSYEKLCFH